MNPQINTLTFNSDSLQALYKMLPEETKAEISELNSSLTESQYILNTKYRDDTLQMHVKFNKYGELAHVGMYVFQIGNNDGYYTKVFEFIEREILIYHLLTDESKILERMNMKDVKLYFNGEIYQTSRYASILTLCSLITDVPFVLNTDYDDYAVTWKLNNVQSLTFKFPNNFTVISGKRKDEIEKEIARDLKEVSQDIISGNTEIKHDLNYYNDSIIVKKSECYEGSEEIASDTYYYGIDSIVPVFDSVNIKESLSNLFLNIIPSGIDLNINHKLYGDQTDQYTININNFFNYFSDEHRIYCGITDSIPDNIQANIFIYNVPFKYVHLLTIRTNRNEVFENSGIIDGTLYTFIRKDNVKKLN